LTISPIAMASRPRNLVQARMVGKAGTRPRGIRGHKLNRHFQEFPVNRSLISEKSMFRSAKTKIILAPPTTIEHHGGS
jgi:hypothetical protein